MHHPELLSAVLTMLLERLPTPTDQLLHTRAAQDLLDRGRQEGEAQGEATTAQIHALPLEQLEALAEALLDFNGPADLATWLEDHAS